MNIDRMNELAKMLEQHAAIENGLGFNMADFVGIEWRGIAISKFRKAMKEGDCNTTCCIGGWACWLWGGDEDWFQASTAQRLLDLDDYQKVRLFFDYQGYVSEGRVGFEEIDRQTAAKAIRRMVEEQLREREAE